MRTKRWRIIAIVSFLLFIGLAIRFAVIASQVFRRPDTVIIGGADAPTAIFVVRNVLLHDPFFILLLAAFVLLVISIVVLLIKRFQKP